MEKESKTKKVVGIPLAILMVFAVVLFFLLFNKRETRISGGTDSEVVTALNCVAGGVESAFFTPSTANTVEHQIKVTFSNDRVDKLFYAFEGVYRTYEIAEQENAVFHAKYNIHMSGNNLEQESLTPTFSTVKTKMRINLYAQDRGMINKATGVLFFVSEDDVDDYLDYSRDQVAEYYEKQGFLCEKQN